MPRSAAMRGGFTLIQVPAKWTALSGSDGNAQLREQPIHAPLDLIANGADVLDAVAVRVFDRPVLVSLSGKYRARVSAAHGDYPGKRYEDWKLADPAGQGVDAVRPIRDGIRTRVETLISEILAAD